MLFGLVYSCQADQPKATPHHTVLTWIASTSAGPGIGYAVFRRDFTGALSTYTQIGSTTGAVTFDDTTATVEGNRYCYQVQTTRASDGNVSDPTPELCASAVPANPAPPSVNVTPALTITVH